MEAILIPNAIGAISKIIPIIQRIQLVKENTTQIHELHQRLTRIHTILNEFTLNQYTTTTKEIIHHLTCKLNEIIVYLGQFEQKLILKKLIRADKYSEKFKQFNEDLSKLMCELSICNLIELKSNANDTKKNDDEMKGQLEVILSRMDELKRNGSVENMHQQLNMPMDQMKELKAMLKELQKDVQNVTVKQLQETNIKINKQRKSFEIVYVKDLVVENEEIGRGSFGIVYLGKWRGLKVAIKRIEDCPYENPDTLTVHSDAFVRNRAILREVKAFEKLNKSPFISRFYGVTSTNGKLGLVIEYIDNCTLYSWLYFDKQLPNEHINKIQLGIAQGLAFMHSQGIAHNDVKSNNVMLDNLFHPRIIDLGMSQMQNSTMLSSIGNIKSIGTDGWRAPEYWQVSESSIKLRREYPFAADIFAFSVLLGEITTRQLPWSKLGSNEIKQAILDGMRPYSQDDIPLSLFQVMVNGWHQNPKYRHDMQDIATELVDVDISPIQDLFINNNVPKEPESYDLSNIYGLDLYKKFKDSIESNKPVLFKYALMTLIQYIELNELKNYILQYKIEIQSKQFANHFENTFFMLILCFFEIGDDRNNNDLYDSFQNTKKEPLSLLFLGFMTANGIGTIKNIDKASKIFKKGRKYKIAAYYFYYGDQSLRDEYFSQKFAYKNYKRAIDGNYSKAYHRIAEVQNNSHSSKGKEIQMKYYDLGAKYGCALSFFYLGRTASTEAQKLKYLEIAANLNCKEAQIQLGDHYSDQNEELAIKYYEIAESWTDLGRMYLHGKVDHDFKKARQYFEKGNSYYYLGQIYEEGLGVSKNMEIAIEYYSKGEIEESIHCRQRLVDIKISSITCNLPDNFEFDELPKTFENLTSDDRKALVDKLYGVPLFKLFEMSINECVPDIFALVSAKLIETVLIHAIKAFVRKIDKHELKLKHLLEKISYNKFTKAFIHYLLYKKRFDASARKCLKLFNQCKDMPLSNIFLYQIYLWGIGTIIDYRISKKYKKYLDRCVNFNLAAGIFRYYSSFTSKEADNLKKAAEVKFGEAYYVVSQYYDKVKCDKSLRFQYLQVAAYYGSQRGLNDLANCYYYGLGCDRDETMAIQYYELAALFADYLVDFGNMGYIYECRNDLKSAFDCYTRSYESKQSGEELGRYYFEGIFVEVDYKKARKCF
eukprot:NODE_260_length_11481_cov_1.187928.p1 type:complete len:1164 gc:universal NODE_260_length_11481_cov_1.187928:707-4198(+)